MRDGYRSRRGLGVGDIDRSGQFVVAVCRGCGQDWHRPSPVCRDCGGELVRGRDPADPIRGGQCPLCGAVFPPPPPPAVPAAPPLPALAEDAAPTAGPEDEPEPCAARHFPRVAAMPAADARSTTGPEDEPELPTSAVASAPQRQRRPSGRARRLGRQGGLDPARGGALGTLYRSCCSVAMAIVWPHPSPARAPHTMGIAAGVSSASRVTS